MNKKLEENSPIPADNPLHLLGESIHNQLRAQGFPGHYVLLFQGKDSSIVTTASMEPKWARRIVCVLAEEFLKEGGTEFAKFVSNAQETIQ